MDEFYTPIDMVGEELNKRWNDDVLKLKIEDYFQRELPTLLINSPRAIMFRNIMTPDGEFSRFYKMAHEVNLKPVGLEYTHDKFVAFNEDKYALTNLCFNFGKRNNGQPRIYTKKIVDIPNAEGRLISEINTIWDEPLDRFHHRFMEISYPGFVGNIEDISSWLHFREGGAKTYYADFMALLIRNGVLIEGFFNSGVEDKFTQEVFIPAFKKIEDYFGIKPLIIKLCGNESMSDPVWWYYKEEQKAILEDLIKSK